MENNYVIALVEINNGKIIIWTKVHKALNGF